jgi:hypothetical protein
MSAVLVYADLFVEWVHQSGHIAQHESFTGFKSKEHCGVTARIDACDDHHLQKHFDIIRIFKSGGKLKTNIYEHQIQKEESSMVIGS